MYFVEMNNKKAHITKQGYQALLNEIKDLEEVKLPAAIKRVAKARSLGDLSENFEYHDARDAHATIADLIIDLKDTAKRAVIIKKNNVKGVDIGKQVRVAVNGSEHVFAIVGEWEANPAEKKISNESPLGVALLGKNVGDKVEVEAPAGKVTYTIKEIN